MPLYGMQAPTGYSAKADAWVNSSALLERMNFALSLSAGKLKGVQLDSGAVLPASDSPGNAQDALVILESKLLSGNTSQQTHDTIEAQLKSAPGTKQAGKQPDIALIEGLLLGSPEFQRR